MASAPSLHGITPSTLPVPGNPFGAAVLPGGRYAVVAVDGTRAADVAVFAIRGGKPRLVRLAPLPGPAIAAGLAISHNGRYLAVTQGPVTTVVRLPELLAGRGDVVLGQLKDGGFGPIEATFSADDRYLFVSDEYSPALSVFNLAKALRAGFSAPGVAVGKLRLGPAVVGSALSPDGRYLYVTSEAASNKDFANGLLQVISVAKAERDPAASLVTAVNAGCQPVRVALSDHGSLAWVTARGSDALLAFDTTDLRTGPAHALRADVRVGPQPVGVVLTDDGRFALTANSARFTAPNSPQTVSVVDTRAALAGRHALTGTIPAGQFPREFGYDPITGEVVLSNFLSNTVEVFRFPAVRCR
ncbi:MAG TPA: YncE family protein [Trebonia sp.]